MPDLQGLRLAFEELDRLNTEALAVLEKALDLDALQPLFERKASVSASLADLTATDPSEGKQGPLDAVQAAQAAAARSEAKLAERLAQLVPPNGNRSPLYGRQKLDKPGGRYDNAV